MKTTNLSRTLFNHHTNSQSINFYIPSTNSSSGSIYDTTASSISSSCRSHINTSDTHNNDDTTSISKPESTVVLLTLIDKLKRELAAVKKANSQLETLYKVSLLNINKTKHDELFYLFFFFSIIFLTNKTSRSICLYLYFLSASFSNHLSMSIYMTHK
jgi:hypothetical protein